MPALPEAVGRGEVLFVPIAVLALWQLLSMVMSDFYVASPAAAFDALVGGASEGWLSSDLGTTASALVIAFALAVAIGLTIGVVLGLSPFLYAVFEPIIVSLWAVPKVALYPIFLLLFGFGTESSAWFAMTFGVFPIIAFAMNGTRNVPPVLLKVSRSMGLGAVRTFRSVLLPAALPSILAGLRIGFGITFLGVVLAEMFAGTSGLGYVLIQNVRLHDMPSVYGLTALLTCTALAINFVLLYVERRLTRGRPSAELGF
jgi:NitT/TauT family transport system permease protein